MNVRLDLPAEVVEAIAARSAELVLERLTPVAAASEFLTVAEAAELLRAKPQRVYDLLSSGRLTRYKDGTRVLVSRVEILGYLAGGVAPARPHSPRSRMRTGVAR